jgi:membrane protease YdiL (CAAX protease family)
MARVLLFLFTLVAIEITIAEIGFRVLLPRWSPEADLSTTETRLAEATRHQNRLAMHLWPFTAAASVALVIAFRRWIDRDRLSGLGLGTGRLSRGLWGVLVGSVLVLAVTTPLVLAPSSRGAVPEGAPGLRHAVLILGTGALAGEVVMRGYVLTNFLQTGRLVYAIIASAFAFTLLNDLGPEGTRTVVFFNLLLFGIVLALLRLWTGTLWAPIGFQIGWNVLLGPVMGFPISGRAFAGLMPPREFAGAPWADLSGGAYGPEGGPLCTAALAIGCFWLARRVPILTNPGARSQP